MFTIGFGRGISREWATWQVEANGIVERSRGDYIDGSGIVSQPLYDEGTKLVMCAGKGDSSIGMFEFVPDEAPYAHFVALYRTTEPQRGIAWMPKSVVDVRKAEIVRFLKLGTNGITPTQLIVPRTRLDYFQVIFGFAFGL